MFNNYSQMDKNLIKKTGGIFIILSCIGLIIAMSTGNTNAVIMCSFSFIVWQNILLHLYK